MSEIPSGYLDEKGNFFPKLEETIATLDLTNPVARGHLIGGRLGTIPLDLRNGSLTQDQAQEMISNFNSRTGLNIQFDSETNTLIYPH